MALQIFWYIVIGVFWVGFFVLEGFDFGVGMLHSFIGRNDLEERLLLNTIGPVWDANEVWLIVVGRPSSPPSRAGTPPCSRPSTSRWYSSCSPS